LTLAGSRFRQLEKPPAPRSEQADSVAIRCASCFVDAAPFRQTVPPLKVMQTSQWNFGVLVVDKIMAANSPTIKITPAITGHLFFGFVIVFLLVDTRR
jgi:hypothetical protein